MRTRAVLAGLSLMGAVLVVAAPPASAAMLNVTTTNDVVNGADGVTSLREAFALANANAEPDTIILGMGLAYNLTNCVGGALVHNADDDLTLTANGSTITQTCSDTGIIVSESDDALLTVDGANLDGGPNSGVTVEGAGVFSEGDLTINDTTITGVDGGAGGNVVNGGFGGDINLDNATITGNDNTAVNSDFGSVFVTGSEISDNNGDGIGLIDGTPLVITDSTISNNARRGASTTGQGNTQVTVTNTTVTANGDTGVSCSACEETTITGSDISGNGDSTPVAGGGVSMTVDQDDPTDAPLLTITDTEIADNTAVRRGGGVFVGIIESSEPTAPPAQVSITESSIDGNQTNGNDMDGGGVAVLTGELTVTDSSISNNSAGVGGNPAGSDGGGIYARESDSDGIDVAYDVTIDGSSVSDNSARGAGGGMAVGTDGTVTVTSSSFDLNDATMSSGGIDLRALSAGITDSTIDDNAATSGGGLTFSGNNVPGFLTIDGSTISNNDADTTAITGGTGGGIDMSLPSGSDMLIRNSTISGNAAFRGGGFHAGVDQLITAELTTFFGNTADFGANIAAPFSPFTLSQSVIVSPFGSENCGPSGPGSFATLGYNFASDDSCEPGPTDTVSAADPLLGPLDDNGGTTLTHLPGDTSPLVGLVPAAACAQPVDQRDIARPQGVDCEPGSVEIVGGPVGPPPITGTNGFDLLIGTPLSDVINALSGDDIVLALASADTVDGGGGNDLLIGGPGDDTILGGVGNDLIFGDDGNDTLVGGPDFDILVGGGGTDTYDGGPGFDLCFIPGQFFPGDC